MYITRPLSLYRLAPEALSLPPPEGANSACLVTYQGTSDHNIIRDLPFPQDKFVTVENEDSSAPKNKVLFIPVINQPLSSNLYYVIAADGKNKGLAYESSREDEGETSCCCCYQLTDKSPRILNPFDPKQQFVIRRSTNIIQTSGFAASSAFPSGVPPKFLRQKWKSTLPTSLLITEEAPGLNSVLRARLPDFIFPLSSSTQEISDPIVVGKWYCPFMFVREQFQELFYVMTLEQTWERIFTCDNNNINDGGGGNSVAVNVVVPTEVVKVNGLEAVAERDEVNNVVWYWSLDERTEEHTRVGLSFAISERMVSEELKAGWIDWPGKQQMVGMVENFYGSDDGPTTIPQPSDDPYSYYYAPSNYSPPVWRKYSCYVLVERFVLRRMDGSLVLTCEFKHTHQKRSKWES